MNNRFSKIHDSMPIFEIVDNDHKIIYTPGSFVVFQDVSHAQLLDYFANPSEIRNVQLQSAVLEILNVAHQNEYKWENRKRAPFSPECLTIHVGNECNLNCEYCYSKIPGNNYLKGFPGIDRIEQAFKYLIENRDENFNKVTVVYHGSGEPTFHWKKLKEAHQLITEISKHSELALFSYLATNGYLKEEQVTWLTQNISLIGISCDGPPEIQKKQRKRNINQYLPLRTTCEILHSKKVQYDIRVTITPETITRQGEIAKYLIEELHAKRIRIEPVYLFQKGFKKCDADIFFENFIDAQNIALRNEVSIEYSGVRVNELHGSYCDVSRNNLRLTPEGFFRNCFCKFPADENFNLGKVTNSNSGLVFSNSILKIKKKAFEIPKECAKCINIYHCSRGCPDYCVHENQNLNGFNLFKCRLNQLLAVDQIKTMANKHFCTNE